MCFNYQRYINNRSSTIFSSISYIKVRMIYNNDEGDILPNPDLVIEYGDALEEKGGEEEDVQ